MNAEEIFLFSSLILAVIIGAGVVQVLNKRGMQSIKILLAFSGGFLLSISFIHLIPEIYHIHSESIGIYILIGFLLQLILEYFSRGVEHGHFHVNTKNIFPLGVFISLSIHSFLEGIPLERELHHTAVDQEFLSHDHGEHALYLGVLFHKIPVAIALMTLFVKAEIPSLKRWVAIFIFSLMAPAGAIIAHYFGESIFGENMHASLDAILAVVIGMLLHVGTTIIFETSDSHKFNAVKLISIIVGVVIAIVLH